MVGIGGKAIVHICEMGDVTTPLDVHGARRCVLHTGAYSGFRTAFEFGLVKVLWVVWAATHWSVTYLHTPADISWCLPFVLCADSCKVPATPSATGQGVCLLWPGCALLAAELLLLSHNFAGLWEAACSWHPALALE